jgi:restriction endonuclease S subunit
MKKKLIDIVEAQFGANVSGKLIGDYPCVQGRDFGSGGEYLGLEPLYIDESELRYTKFLKRGDILFSTKGKLFATVWEDQMQKTVATGTFLILNVKDPSVLPEYLALYLNSSKAKKYYDLHTKTATVNHIGKKQLDLLEVEIPPIQKQNLLIQLHKLLIEEKKLTNNLLNKKEKILNYLI